MGVISLRQKGCKPTGFHTKHKNVVLEDNRPTSKTGMGVLREVVEERALLKATV